MTTTSTFSNEIDGREAGAGDLSALAFAGFAHFTAMQVRDGAVRGLDLHLGRLRSASLTFFGRAMPDALVRDRLRSAIARGPSELSLVATMFSRAGEFTRAGTMDDPGILVRTTPAYRGPAGPLSLAAVEHERPMPELKQVGESAKTYHLRSAVQNGHDDAAFVDSKGRLSEATIWNLAFWDGHSVVWPDARQLPGVTMAIVRRQLDSRKTLQRSAAVRIADLEHLKGAAVMNSWNPGIAVTRIDATSLPASPDFLALLHDAYEREPFVTV